MINDNYFGRSGRMRLTGSWVMRSVCEIARFPGGERVGHGRAGAAVARQTGVGKDIGGSCGGGGHERADGGPLAERWVAVDGEGVTVVADMRGSVRRRLGVGGGAAAGRRHARPAAGADAVQGAVPAASGPLSSGEATDVATAGAGVARCTARIAGCICQRSFNVSPPSVIEESPTPW